jgi:hypothetical protein
MDGCDNGDQPRCLVRGRSAGRTWWSIQPPLTVAGAGAGVSGTLSTSAEQQQVPQQMLARLNAITLTGAYALGSAGVGGDRPAGRCHRSEAATRFRRRLRRRQQRGGGRPAGDQIALLAAR